MDTADVVLIALVVLAAFVMFSTSFREDYQARLARKLAERSGLAPTAEQLPLLQEKIGRRQRGAVVGALVAGVAAWLLTFDEATSDRLLILAGALAAGGGAGIALTALRNASRRPSDLPVFARSTSVTLADYSAPSDRFLAWGLVALAIIGCGVASFLTTAPLSPLLVGLTVAAVAALVFFEISARRIVALGQPAGSVTELVFNDALRAGYVFDLLVAPITLGTYATLIALSTIVASLGEPVVDAFRPWAPLALLALIVACSFLSVRADSRRHYLRRLWPDIAARGDGRLAVISEETK